jgi:hypothetical protein
MTTLAQTSRTLSSAAYLGKTERTDSLSLASSGMYPSTSRPTLVEARSVQGTWTSRRRSPSPNAAGLGVTLRTCKQKHWMHRIQRQHSWIEVLVKLSRSPKRKRKKRPRRPDSALEMCCIDYSCLHGTVESLLLFVMIYCSASRAFWAKVVRLLPTA